MTPDPHANDPELRDPSGLDAHLDGLGAALEQGVGRAEQRRHRARMAAGTVTAIAAVGLGALVALPGGRELDPVAEARAAVGDGSGILHFVVRTTFEPPAGSKIRVTSQAPAIEVWTAIEGEDRYRLRAPADGKPRYCSITALSGMTKYNGRNRMMGPLLVEPADYAAVGRTTTTYSAFSRAAVVVTRPQLAKQLVGGQAVVPAFGENDPRDPVRTIQAALRTGALSDGGTVTVNGRALRRLVGRGGPTVSEAQELEAKPYFPERAEFRKRQIERGLPTLPTRYEYLVDAATFAPVEMRTRRYNVWSKAGGRPHWKWNTQVDRFEQFEILDDTAEHRALLTVPLPEGTTVYRSDERGRFHPPISFEQAARDQEPAMARCRAAKR